MRWLYKLPLRFRSLFRTRRVEQELTDELRFHLGELTEEYVAKGMTPEEARYAACGSWVASSKSKRSVETCAE